MVVSSKCGAHITSSKRPPLLSSGGENGVVGNRRAKSREVISRYQTPIASRTAAAMSPTQASPASAAIKRSQSTERRRLGTPRPSNLGNSSEISTAAKMLVGSTRSLSVSFQGGSFSLPMSKEKPATERRKATPARDATENSKLVDQRRWPGRSRDVNSLTRSLDCTGDRQKLGGSGTGAVVRALQQSMISERSRLKGNSTNTEIDKSVYHAVDANSDSGAVQERGNVSRVRGGPRGIMVPARFLQESTHQLRQVPEPVSPMSKNNGLKTVAPPKFNALSCRGLPSPVRGAARSPSPSKIAINSASSPSGTIPSPSRIRNGVASKVSNELWDTPSILSFSADLRRGRVGENRVFDAHLLRLLYNRHLQWRFINARADSAMLVQKVTAEESLYNAWVSTLKLRHSVKAKRAELQLLQKNLKLYSILKGQIPYLDDWDLIDQDHLGSLSEAIEALEASTLRLPVVGGARVDIQNLKDAICSAVDVMQGMGSSIFSLLTKVDKVNSLVYELANSTAKEHALLEHCKDLLSTLTVMQVKNCSLGTHILQLRRTP
ncbi:QWRF motif-containing protein 2-like [Diospyros lotus]|uniref:QWRF motif-containing protein 2-like n=1 Tax=Diospyros lotus TaxID=55363 RepID=UPI0022545BD6|nr:QWRF motif-containing protein 2-like [Diospyros lotus]